MLAKPPFFRSKQEKLAKKKPLKKQNVCPKPVEFLLVGSELFLHGPSIPTLFDMLDPPEAARATCDKPTTSQLDPQWQNRKSTSPSTV